MEIVFDRVVHIEKMDKLYQLLLILIDTNSYWTFCPEPHADSWGDTMWLTMDNGRGPDNSFNMLESGMILSFEVHPNLYSSLGYTWPTDHRIGFNEIFSDFVVRDLHGNEVLLKDIIPDQYYWDENFSGSPIPIAHGTDGENYDFYKELYDANKEP